MVAIKEICLDTISKYKESIKERDKNYEKFKSS